MIFVQVEWSPLWVVDFPLFEYDAQEKRWQVLHHLFMAAKLDSVAELQFVLIKSLRYGIKWLLNWRWINRYSWYSDSKKIKKCKR